MYKFPSEDQWSAHVTAVTKADFHRNTALFLTACGEQEKHNQIMHNLAWSAHSYRILTENFDKAFSLNFRITNSIKTRHYVSFLRMTFDYPMPKPITVLLEEILNYKFRINAFCDNKPIVKMSKGELRLLAIWLLYDVYKKSDRALGIKEKF